MGDRSRVRPRRVLTGNRIAVTINANPIPLRTYNHPARVLAAANKKKNVNPNNTQPE
jgi:hypothetical protein